MEETILGEMKEIIVSGTVNDLHAYVRGLLADKKVADGVSYENLYHHAYLHACLKNRPEMVQWLTRMLAVWFDTSAEGSARHIRWLFAYGRVLMGHHAPATAPTRNNPLRHLRGRMQRSPWDRPVPSLWPPRFLE